MDSPSRRASSVEHGRLQQKGAPHQKRGALAEEGHPSRKEAPHQKRDASRRREALQYKWGTSSKSWARPAVVGRPQKKRSAPSRKGRHTRKGRPTGRGMPKKERRPNTKGAPGAKVGFVQQQWGRGRPQQRWWDAFSKNRAYPAREMSDSSRKVKPQQRRSANQK